MANENDLTLGYSSTVNVVQTTDNIGHLSAANDVPTTDNIPSDNAPSLENPTWDYLFHNFNKVELQKHCRNLGLLKIWTTKDKLVDMIMHAQGSSRALLDQNGEDESAVSLHRIFRELREMREKLAEKDTEIEELNSAIKNAQITINRLSDRVTTLEDKVKNNELCVTESTRLLRPPLMPERTLLLGDSTLSEVHSSDLGENCSIRTLQGATMDLARCWVKEDLDWSPTKCVLYCGIHDVIEDDSPEVVLDNLGSLIADLKVKNENMEISVCELVPSVNEEDLDIKINQFNNKLDKWSESNGISIIKTNLEFRLGTGEVNELCFREDGIFLNRFGIVRLLTTLSKKCDFFELAKNWKDISRSHGPLKHASQVSSNRYDKSLPYKRQSLLTQNKHSTSQSRTRNYREPVAYTNSKMYVRSGSNQTDQYNHRFPNVRVNLNDSYRRTEYGSTIQGNASHRDRQRGEGCYNCGERNHRSDTCRYDHKIRCTECHQLGHKTKFCSYFSR